MPEMYAPENARGMRVFREKSIPEPNQRGVAAIWWKRWLENKQARREK
jgi:hypothetical protein